MRGTASACGSATIINAIATGEGGAFAIDLRVKSTVSLTEDRSEISGKVGDTGEDPELIEICVEKVLEREGVRDQFGAQIETDTELPIAVGLSSSSAAANATVLATYAALGEEVEPEEAIEIGIESAFDAGATVTGAFDDAAASYLGGEVVTDNDNREILKKIDVDPKLRVLIYLPSGRSYTTEVDVERIRFLEELISVPRESALNGNFFGAQTVNGLIYSSVLGYDPQPALDAISAGAECSGLTGTGPATVAVSKKKNVEKIINVWNSKEGRVLRTRPSREGARIENGR
ncbi:hypothetical protein AKJ64_01055 [candidate division MSBL1 archaeon SCGC-AAA259E17]|uniref:Shikimate kinase n=1 Tax=candidate division MSBL1 archaeon SCGC-AAA259E17 TaxID=1698263 RepID=A0A133UGH6_9EURY|nr:hypothetical protein AKJ64_01055 [candidate division MSBL1 archaeon SCGC-AAA259E17]